MRNKARLIQPSAKNNNQRMKSYVLVGFVILAIVGVICLTRQQRERERFDVDPAFAKELVDPNIRLSIIQKKQEKLQDAINAGAGKAAMNGLM